MKSPHPESSRKMMTKFGVPWACAAVAAKCAPAPAPAMRWRKLLRFMISHLIVCGGGVVPAIGWGDGKEGMGARIPQMGTESGQSGRLMRILSEFSR